MSTNNRYVPSTPMPKFYAYTSRTHQPSSGYILYDFFSNPSHPPFFVPTSHEFDPSPVDARESPPARLNSELAFDGNPFLPAFEHTWEMAPQTRSQGLVEFENPNPVTRTARQLKREHSSDDDDFDPSRNNHKSPPKKRKTSEPKRPKTDNRKQQKNKTKGTRVTGKTPFAFGQTTKLKTVYDKDGHEVEFTLDGQVQVAGRVDFDLNSDRRAVYKRNTILVDRCHYVIHARESTERGALFVKEGQSGNSLQRIKNFRLFISSHKDDYKGEDMGLERILDAQRKKKQNPLDSFEAAPHVPNYQDEVIRKQLLATRARFEQSLTRSNVGHFCMWNRVSFAGGTEHNGDRRSGQEYRVLALSLIAVLEDDSEDDLKDVLKRTVARCATERVIVFARSPKGITSECIVTEAEYRRIQAEKAEQQSFSEPLTPRASGSPGLMTSEVLRTSNHSKNQVFTERPPSSETSPTSRQAGPQVIPPPLTPTSPTFPQASQSTVHDSSEVSDQELTDAIVEQWRNPNADNPILEQIFKDIESPIWDDQEKPSYDFAYDSALNEWYRKVPEDPSLTEPGAGLDVSNLPSNSFGQPPMKILGGDDSQFESDHAVQHGPYRPVMSQQDEWWTAHSQGAAPLAPMSVPPAALSQYPLTTSPSTSRRGRQISRLNTRQERTPPFEGSSNPVNDSYHNQPISYPNQQTPPSNYTLTSDFPPGTVNPRVLLPKGFH